MAKLRHASLLQSNIKGLDKESHLAPLAKALARAVKTEPEALAAAETANAVISAVRERGATSFFAAEYAKLFKNPAEAVSARGRVASRFEIEHGLSPKQAAKMADCIVFASAKKGESSVDRLAGMASIAVGAGYHHDVVADVVYYNKPEVSAEVFASRCESTSHKKNRPAGMCASDLAARLLIPSLL